MQEYVDTGQDDTDDRRDKRCAKRGVAHQHLRARYGERAARVDEELRLQVCPLTCLLAARACWCIRCSKLVILTLPAGEPLPLPLAPLAAAALDVDAAGFLDVLELALAPLLMLPLLPVAAALPLLEEAAAATLPVLPLPVGLDEEAAADVDAFGGIV